MVLFTVAGNDTTRNTTSLTTVAFDRNPDQRALPVGGLRRADHAGRRGVRATRLTGDAVHAHRARRHRARRPADRRRATRCACSTARETVTSQCSTAPRTSTCPGRRTRMSASAAAARTSASAPGLARSQLRAITGELLTRVPDIEVGEPEFAAGNFIRVVNQPAGARALDPDVLCRSEQMSPGTCAVTQEPRGVGTAPTGHSGRRGRHHMGRRRRRRLRLGRQPRCSMPAVLDPVVDRLAGLAGGGPRWSSRSAPAGSPSRSRPRRAGARHRAVPAHGRAAAGQAGRRRRRGHHRRHGDDPGRRLVPARLPRVQHDHEPDDTGRAGRRASPTPPPTSSRAAAS